MATPELTATVAAFQSPENALFEGMNGVTGTGLTMTWTEDHLPHALQWWRSLMQWVGGIGVVVLTAAVMLTSESDALQSLYEEKAAVQSIRPDTRETIEALWWIFCLLTFVATAAFWLAGMPPWHALNHAMTGVSTGGFVVVDEGIAAYDSGLLEAAVVPFMLLGATSFAVHYYLLQGEAELLWRDVQTRWLLGLAAAGAAVVAAAMTAVDPAASAVRYGGFQYVSALT